MREIFQVSSHKARECLDITERVREIVRRSGVHEGLCHVMVLHATAALAINENADPGIGEDLLDALDRSVPKRAGWRHDRIDGNAAAHIQAALLGPSELIPVQAGDLLLGTWQGLMLLELDGPRPRRRVAVSLIPARPGH
ncbi:MAG: secondary thiamine-phosphate synthase enzyme YjbQ [Myxococcota bacterium]